jgi:hypothetical protein
MGVAQLPVVAELRHGSLLARGDEDRVVAEAFRAARRLGDAAFQDAGAAELAAVRRDQDELADVARRAILDAFELAQELRVRLAALGAVAR